MVIVLKLGQWQQVIPIILSFINKEVKVLFQLLIDSLCLAITLQVICSCHSKLDAEESVEFSGEFGNELQPSV